MVSRRDLARGSPFYVHDDPHDLTSATTLPGRPSIYLQGIDTEEIIATVHARRAPMMSQPPDFDSDRRHQVAGAPTRRSRRLPSPLSLRVGKRAPAHADPDGPT